MALISQPPTNAVDTQDGTLRIAGPSEGWRNFFVAVFNICNALTMSGTTAQRPTTLLWVGRPYLDETLGIPIWLKSITPTVWIDGTGAPV